MVTTTTTSGGGAPKAIQTTTLTPKTSSGAVPSEQERRSHFAGAGGGGSITTTTTSSVMGSVTTPVSPVGVTPFAPAPSPVPVQRVEVQRAQPFSERLDRTLQERNPDYLLVRNAINEAGLKATERNPNKINLAVQQYLARRGQANVSLQEGGSGLVTYVPPSTPTPSPRFEKTTSFNAPYAFAPVSVSVPTATPIGRQQDFGGIFENTAVGLVGFAGETGRKIGGTFERTIPGSRRIIGDVLSSPFSPFGSIFKQFRDSPQQFERGIGKPVAAGAGFVIGLGVGGLAFRGIGTGVGVVSKAVQSTKTAQSIYAPISKVPQVVKVFELGGTVSQSLSKAPSIIKTGAIFGTGLVAEAGGGFITGVEKESQATQFSIGGTKEARLSVLEDYQANVIGRGLKGSVTEVIDGKGNIVTTSIEPPSLGGQDLFGEAQRFTAGNIPGIISFFTPEEQKRQAAIKSLEAQGFTVSEKNIKETIMRGESVGIYSTAGLFASEFGSEVLGSQLIRTGSAGIRAAKTVKEQASALSAFTVPRVALVAGAEGFTQTLNIGSLTQRNVDFGSLAIGTGAGALSGGLFTFALAQAIPRGYKNFVQVAGYAVDFPGEPGGDILESGFSRAIRRGEGLRVPIVSETILFDSAPTKSRKTSAGGFTDFIGGSRTSKTGGKGVIVDEFNLPINLAPKTTVPSLINPNIGTNPITGAITNTTANAQSNFFYDTRAETNVGIDVSSNTNTNFNANFQNLVNVPTIAATGFPFFPAGGLGKEEGSGGRGTRLGYFDELAAVFGSTFNNPIGVFGKRKKGRPSRVNRKQRKAGMKMQRKTIQSFIGYKNFFKRGKRK